MNRLRPLNENALARRIEPGRHEKVTCPSCSAAVPENSRFCSACGGPIDSPSVSPTRTFLGEGAGPAGSPRPDRSPASASRTGRSASSGSTPDERFAPGAVLAGRYRIIGPLGRGGMGEVYRADDLKLGQPVALKFLPEHLSRDEDRLARLLGEVKIARQVSHPNVCRVYDAGEAEGLHFLSMEYVDGEDLATLIRRIGRLSPDKGVEIARQICAGLAAAHDRGVIHRDLKPANVMIDGRGKVRITDFGLAGLAEDSRGSQGRSGTPAYMAPELLAGGEATVRSDLYALGLVLYELFTGKSAFKSAPSLADLRRMREVSEMASPSTHVSDLDPAVERIILRCLEPDSRARPASALAVAAALPGGDPLAAALAAGETPSPEMVAAAGEEGTLRPAVGIPCLAGFLAMLLLLVAVSDRIVLYRKVPFDLPPEVLTDRAGQILRAIGCTEKPGDVAKGFLEHQSYLTFARESDFSRSRWEPLATGRAPGILFWYRQSPQDLAPTEWNGSVSPLDPPDTLSGMTSIDLDTRGRLLLLERVPPQLPEIRKTPAPDPDWGALFREAGLEMKSFSPSEPEWVPLFHADRRVAWTGNAPELPATPLRIEAASFQGTPVYFQVIGPWTKPRRMQPLQPERGAMLATNIGIVMILMVMAAGILAVRYNLRCGRGDRRGALRICLYLFSGVLLAWALSADHVPTILREYVMFQKAVGLGMYVSGVFWISYMALEPFIRRAWPEILVGWSRLVAGRWRDPRVGRDVLFGAMAGLAVCLLFCLDHLLPAWLGLPESRPASTNLAMLLGGGDFMAVSLFSAVTSVLNAMAIVALIFLVLFLVRKRWVATGVVWVVLTLLLGVGAASDLPALDFAVFGLAVAFLLALLVRYGVLALIVSFYFAFQNFPLSMDVTAWYGSYSLISALLLAAVGVYGYLTSRGRRSLPGAGAAPAL